MRLLFRAAMGAVYLRAGYDKIADWSLTLELFRDEYRVPLLAPAVAATVMTGLELGCAMLLIAGLVTRVAATVVLAMIIVVQIFVYSSAWAEHLAWASIVIFLLAYGGGRWSLDELLFGRSPDDTASPPAAGR